MTSFVCKANMHAAIILEGDFNPTVYKPKFSHESDTLKMNVTISNAE